MGGSGGSFYNESKNKEDKNAVDKAIEDLFDKQLEIEISDCLNDILKNVNDRDTQAINKHINEIIKGLEIKIEGSINSLFGGSVAKHTFLDGFSDVDTLLIINDSELINKTPEEVKDYIEKRLKEKYPNTIVHKGILAITIDFNDYSIQLIPAIKRGNSIMIPNSTGKDWSHKIDPMAFTSKLTDLNSNLNSKLVPVIKLAKAIIYSYPEQKRLKGYHIESLALEIFQNYKKPITSAHMLKYFFEESPNYVLKPIKDKTGQSTHVDDYLKNENSLERELVADALRNTARKMKIATTVEQWEQFFE